MTAAKEYTKEQLNYYRICYITTDILAEGLRTVFKQEWDIRYNATLGEWKDEPKNGLDFKNGESPRKQREKARLLATMVNGNRAEWDCTMLFYAILFSDCIGGGLDPTVRSKVDDLRRFRNEDFAHMPHGHLTDTEFQNAISKVDVAFQTLSLSTVQIQETKTQATFPTEELAHIMKKVEDLKQEIQVLEDQLNRDISSFCVIPPQPSHDVAGRDCEVANITQRLRELKKANENSLSYLYITGNPGSGKSQLAGLVATRFFDEGKEIPCSTSFVMTVNAESPSTLLESYVFLARKLKCPEYAISNAFNSADLNTNEKTISLKTLIGTKVELYTSWLLVVDNVTSISKIHSYLPESGNEQWARGQLLITTQDTTSVPLTSSCINYVSISRGMEPQDAMFLLEKLSGISDCKVEKVAQALDYQPLALASAATYVREVRQIGATSNFGWNNYLQKLEKGQRVPTENNLVNTNPIYPKSMTKAIQLAVQKAIASDNIIKHTFTLLSLCAPQPLSLEIVANYIRSVEVEMQDEEAISVKIKRCSLLLLDEEKSGVYMRIHQVVHDAISTVIKDHCEAHEVIAMNGAVKSLYQFVEDNRLVGHGDLNSVVRSIHIVPHLETLITAIKRAFSKQDISDVAENDMFNTQSYYYHFGTLGLICEKHCAFYAAKEYFNLALRIRLAKDGPEHVDVARTYTCLGSVHSNLGDLNQAKEYHDRALAISLKNLGPEHVDVANTYDSLGTVHSKLGDWNQAKEYSDHALAIRLKKLGPEHVDVAKTYHNLAIVHSDLGDLNQAKEYYDRALAIKLKKLGPEHVDVAKTYDSLGTVHSKLGDWNQAKEYSDHALAIRLKKLGPEHVDVAKTYHNLGNIHRNLGDPNEAKEYYDRALAITLKKLGPEHVDVAKTYHNLAIVHSDLGDLNQAKEYYDRALAIKLKKLGPEHVDVAKTYDSLGTVHSKLGDWNQAKEYSDHALAIRLKKLGPEHVDVAKTYHNLGNIHRNLGDPNEAKEYYDRALAITLKKLGPEHVDVAKTYHNLAIVHSDLGDLNQAKEYYDRALAIKLKKLGPEHVDVANTYDSLGNIHCNLGDPNEAKEYYDRALAITLKKLGPEHVDVAKTYDSLGTVHSKLGDWNQAKEYSDHALAIRLKKLGPEHVDVANTYHNLGNVHRNLGDPNEAKEYYDRALAITLKKLGPEHVDVAKTYHNLAIVHSDLGDLNQAKEYYDRALAIKLKNLGPEHVDVASTYNNLGNVHRNLGDLNQAKEYYDRALAIKLKNLGPEHVDVATTYSCLGNVHRDLGDPNQAKVYHDLALAIRLKKLGPEHVGVATTYNNLGNVHSNLGDLNQAKEYYDRALAICRKKLRPENDLVRNVQQNVVKLTQLQENSQRFLGVFGKRRNCSGQHELVTAKRVKKK